jgi:predicted methyltransferase
MSLEGTFMMRVLILAGLLIPASLTAASAATQAPSAAVRAAVADAQRTPANRQRDRYRHPAETLAFFGVRPEQTVVEFQPSGGWYTEILAPMLSAKGHYVGLVAGGQRAQDSFSRLLAAGGERYRGARMATLDPATGSSTVPDGSADVVLTFRNVHNLIMGGGNNAANSFRAFARMLKPGGTLGVVDHRLPEEMSADAERESGYVKRSTIIRLAQDAGFRLAAESKVNANPRDTHQWPKGVWTLPPSLQLGDTDRAKYLAIGESDRLTLRFVKSAR